MPNLIEFAKKCTFKDRESTADNTNTQVELLLVSIREWARNSKPKLSVSEKEQLSNALKDQTDILKKVGNEFQSTSKTMLTFLSQLSRPIETQCKVSAMLFRRT